MEKFIAIYKDRKSAAPVIRDTLESIFTFENLDNKIFASYTYDDAMHTAYKLYTDPGIWFYDENKMKTKFFIPNKYELVEIKPSVPENRPPQKGSYSYELTFRFEDLISKKIVEITVDNGYFPNVLDGVIKEIVLASKFDSWDEYQDDKAYKNENIQLKAENEKLKKEIEQLKQM